MARPVRLPARVLPRRRLVPHAGRGDSDFAPRQRDDHRPLSTVYPVLLTPLVGALVTVVSMGVLVVTLDPARPTGIALATLLAAMIYGIVGALVGTLLGRLSGVYAMLFGPSLDVFLFQNPAGSTDLPVELLLGHYPTALTLEAEFGGGIATETLALGVAYLIVVTLVSSVLF